MNDTSFEKFATEYDKKMGDKGDYTHEHTIDPALFAAVRDPKDLKVYDIGCGNGYIPRKLVSMGAKEVWASDISKSLIEIAKNKYDDNNIKYLVQDGSNFSNIPKNYFNLITLNMVIHYIADLNTFFLNVHNSLKIDGRVVFTVDHPLHSMTYADLNKEVSLEKILSELNDYNKVTSFDIKSYWNEDVKVHFYHRPLSTYVNIMSENNLYIDALIEPKTKMQSYDVGSTPKESNIPFKMAIGAVKKK